jgi:hypothetical protein
MMYDALNKTGTKLPPSSRSASGTALSWIKGFKHLCIGREAMQSIGWWSVSEWRHDALGDVSLVRFLRYELVRKVGVLRPIFNFGV